MRKKYFKIEKSPFSFSSWSESSLSSSSSFPWLSSSSQFEPAQLALYVGCGVTVDGGGVVACPLLGFLVGVWVG